MNFDETASHILKEYIRAGICIDNDYAPPYPRNDEEKKKDTEIPQKLYHSFRNDAKCDLDIYCYKDKEEWNIARNYAFCSKDLLILDWELTDVDPKFEDALQILAEAIESETIQFVIIYTRVPDLTEVELSILSYFGPYMKSNGELQDKIRSISEQLENFEEIKDVELFIEKIKPSLKDLSLSINEEQLKERKKVLISSIKDCYEGEEQIGHKIVQNFFTIIKKVFDLSQEESELFYGALISNKLPNTHHEQKFYIKKVESERIFYTINNTVVMIFPNEKSEAVGVKHINANNVFEEFSKVIYKNPHSFITLLSLEMKDLYRSKISNLGKDLLRINEKAFFYQMDTYETKEEFYNFLINSWNNEINNFSRENIPNLLQSIEDYREKNNLKSINIHPYYNELVKMGYLLSCSTEKKINNRKLKFGDIFIQKETLTGREFYFLNITPHCDCLRPEKINFNFHFIVSTSNMTPIAGALRNVEKNPYTFICKDTPLVIEWKTKPFTLFIKDGLIQNEKLSTFYIDSKIELSYLTTLKENFTQRLANLSFAYAMRVGIDHPHLKS